MGAVSTDSALLRAQDFSASVLFLSLAEWFASNARHTAHYPRFEFRQCCQDIQDGSDALHLIRRPLYMLLIVRRSLVSRCLLRRPSPSGSRPFSAPLPFTRIESIAYSSSLSLSAMPLASVSARVRVRACALRRARLARRAARNLSLRLSAAGGFRVSRSRVMADLLTVPAACVQNGGWRVRPFPAASPLRRPPLPSKSPRTDEYRRRAAVAQW